MKGLKLVFENVFVLSDCLRSLECGLKDEIKRDFNRVISKARLRDLRLFHLLPINVVVYHDSQRDLVLRGVSCLDAFSSYPDRT